VDRRRIGYLIIGARSRAAARYVRAIRIDGKRRTRRDLLLRAAVCARSSSPARLFIGIEVEEIGMSAIPWRDTAPELHRYRTVDADY